MHVIYPRLFEKLRRAEGAVGALCGGRFAPTYEGYDASDFARELEDLHLPTGEKVRLLSLLEQDREGGTQQLKAVARRVDVDNARRSLSRVMNYMVLKGLYLSPAVKELALSIHEHLVSAQVDIHVSEMPGAAGRVDTAKVPDALKTAEAKLVELEALMRRELQPSSKEVGT